MIVMAQKGVALTFDMVLLTAGTTTWKTTPTIAAGDFKVSKDGGALANLTTLPSESPAGSGIVAVALSATEMTADRVTVKAHDAAGAEWDDNGVTIVTDGQWLVDTKSLHQSLNLMIGMLAGVASGTNTNAPVYQNLAGDKTRATFNADGLGNRSSVTIGDLT